MSSPRKGQTHTSLESGENTSLAKEAVTLGGRGSRWAVRSGWDDRLAAPRRQAMVHRPRTRTNRKRGEELAVLATGEASDWLHPFANSRFSHDSRNIWNPLLTAMVHRIGDKLQRALSDYLGKVALTCHFACDLQCEEMCGI